MQTGPKTNAGKAQSRLNAVKHGFEATDDIFLQALKPTERKAFQCIRRTLFRHYQPRNNLEKLNVDRIAIHYLRMLRVSQHESLALYFLPVNQSEASILPQLDRLSRYDVRIERQIQFLHKRLQSMQKKRSNKTRNISSVNH